MIRENSDISQNSNVATFRRFHHGAVAMRVLAYFLAILCASLTACSSTVPTPGDLKNIEFPRVRGRSLQGEEITIPDHYRGKPVLLLVGYQQRAQFDIDRWILGTLQADIPVEIVEVPTIAGLMPQAVQGFIDGGMRSGIPKTDWASVVTVYGDADKIIQALGNERPQVGYALLLDQSGKIVWSRNEGYSAANILELKKVVGSMPWPGEEI